VLIVPANPRLLGPVPSCPLPIFYRFTIEETIENGDRAHRTLDNTTWRDVSGVEVTLRADHLVPVPKIGSCATRSRRLELMLPTPGSRPLEAHPAGSALRGESVGIPMEGGVSAEAPTTLAVDEPRAPRLRRFGRSLRRNAEASVRTIETAEARTQQKHVRRVFQTAPIGQKQKWPMSPTAPRPP
jgi:hypothetical protein